MCCHSVGGCILKVWCPSSCLCVCRRLRLVAFESSQELQQQWKYYYVSIPSAAVGGCFLMRFCPELSLTNVIFLNFWGFFVSVVYNLMFLMFV